MSISFPKPLGTGSLIAVPAPSSGVTGKMLARLDAVIATLNKRGFRVLEGECLRKHHKDESAPVSARAAELNRFLLDPEVAAIFPPWGGERAIELLPLIDFEQLRSVTPKWLIGYSDTSTLQLPLTLISGWATAHGPNLMDPTATPDEPLTINLLANLSTAPGGEFAQRSATKFQSAWPVSEKPIEEFALDKPSKWKLLNGRGARQFSGRLVGGCLDTVSRLAGSKYGYTPEFCQRHSKEGVILFLENCELAPPELLRALISLKFNGWFDTLNGLLIGRNSGPDQSDDTRLSYIDVLTTLFATAPYPVIYDADIGHKPPQMTLVMGALASVDFDGEVAQVRQQLG